MSLCNDKLDFAFGVEKVIHLLVVREGLVGKVTALTGGFGNLFQDG